MSKDAKRFDRAVQRREFYDRKVRIVGFSRVLSLSKVIPEDWGYVRITPLRATEKTIEVLFEKLMGVDEAAHSEKNHKRGKRDT